MSWLREPGAVAEGDDPGPGWSPSVWDAASQRLWDTLYRLLNTGQRAVLDALLTSPPGARVSELDRLRRGPVRISGPQMKGRWSGRRR